MKRLVFFTWGMLLLSAGTVLAPTWVPHAVAADPYLEYVRTAPEFRPVPQDPSAWQGRWNTWIYMPWRYQWTIGTDDLGGQFCRDYGINGGFTDHGEGPLAWLEKWHLQFYNDHTAGKGGLYLRGANDRQNFVKYQRDPRAIRSGTDGPQPIDAAHLKRLQELIARNIGQLHTSPMRVAYALDDEISWGAFVQPLPWRLNDDEQAYTDWLERYYGGQAPAPQYVTPDFILPQLDRSLAELDFSPLLDRITYQDSVWANFLGELVTYANQIDPTTPCGFVGGQSPNMWGGYDYAKLMKKIQFLEAYNLGSAQAIARSFNPGHALPLVTTHFHSDERGVQNDIWQSWYYFAHGNRGMIGWVEGWFDDTKPRPWLDEYRATLKELGSVQGPKLVGARWQHDGVGIYYSHPSIQVSWCLDIEPHRKTWVNRGSTDHRLGTSHLVRRAWEDLLTDAGLQYSFVSYDQVITAGVPQEYRVLILPACYALSDVEVERISEFCRSGGTVVADFACGLFDQHGKGRKAGALDKLFGVRHTGKESRSDFFSGRLWVESDQDAGFSAATWRELLDTLPCRQEQGFAVAEQQLPIQTVTQVGRGQAVYLNLSPQRYLQYRQEGTASQALRQVFLQQIQAVTQPRVQVTASDPPLGNLEVTTWQQPDRTYVFVMHKAATGGDPTGGNWGTDLQVADVAVELGFPAAVQDVVNERTGERLGNGRSFRLRFTTCEAALLSYRS